MSKNMLFNDAALVAIKGKIINTIETTRDTVTMMLAGGGRVKLYHDQDCCESVDLEELVGDLADLIGEPLLEAEEVSSADYPAPDEEYMDESFTWTFYKFGTRKGFVTLRWLGMSNGYYSESVTVSYEPLFKPGT